MHCIRHPNSNGEYANANASGVRLKALTDLTRNKCLVWPELIVGGINFGWMAVWVLSPDWTFIRLLGENANHGGKECGPCPEFAS